MAARVRRALPYLALIAVVVGFVNFFWLLAESAALGGDALNGYASQGHYFVNSHGSYTEVSEASWTWSRVHSVSVFITHPLAMAGMFYLLVRFVVPQLTSVKMSKAETLAAWPGHPNASRTASAGLTSGTPQRGPGAPQSPAGIIAALGVIGVVVNIAMIGIGLFWAIPHLGLVGVVWTGFAAVIATINVRRLLFKR